MAQVPGDRLRASIQAGPARSLRSATMASSVAWLVRCGLVCGRRERDSNAVSPSARYRATRICTHRRDTPYSRATTLLGRPSSTTAVITTRASDIAHHPAHQDANDVPRHPRTMS